jgi:N-acyl-D-aspartate/D-glutamate deacylase
VLARYVRERGVLTLEQAIHKMTALPASRVKLSDRGVLRAGAFADVTVFDPDRVADRADFADPFQYPVGFLATLVNGVVAVDGDARGPRSGRALRG